MWEMKCLQHICRPQGYSDTCSVTMNENITVFAHKKTPQAFVVNKCHSKSKREFEILNVRYKPHQTFANDLLVV